MRISDWSSDVCSSDLPEAAAELQDGAAVPSPAGCPVGRGEGEVDPLAHGEAIDALQQQGEAEAAFQLDDDRWLIAPAGDQIAAAHLRFHGIALALEEGFHGVIELFFADDGHAGESSRVRGVDARESTPAPRG